MFKLSQTHETAGRTEKCKQCNFKYLYNSLLCAKHCVKPFIYKSHLILSITQCRRYNYPWSTHEKTKA